MGGIVILIINWVKCLAQHISRQQSINKATLQVLMALDNFDYSLTHPTTKEVIKAWMAEVGVCMSEVLFFTSTGKNI